MPTQAPAYDPAMDGVDHINVYSRGRTELGRELTNFAHTPFTVPGDGSFASMEGYWYWLQCADEAAREQLRPLYGFRAKQVGRELRVPDYGRVHDLEFRRSIARAIREKIRQNPHVAAMLAASTLPFAHYYVYGANNRGCTQPGFARRRLRQAGRPGSPGPGNRSPVPGRTTAARRDPPAPRCQRPCLHPARQNPERWKGAMIAGEDASRPEAGPVARVPAPRQALDALYQLGEQVSFAFSGVTPTADPAEASEVERFFTEAVAALDQTLAAVDPDALAAVRAAARATAAILAEYDPDDQLEARAKASALAARVIARRLLAAYDGSTWGGLLWELQRAYDWMRQQMTEDEDREHCLGMPWPELERIETAVALVIDG